MEEKNLIIIVIIFCILMFGIFLVMQQMNNSQLAKDNFNLADAYYSQQNYLISLCKIDFNEYQRQELIEYAKKTTDLFMQKEYDGLRNRYQGWDYNFLNRLESGKR